jgi:hypothetical protein
MLQVLGFHPREIRVHLIVKVPGYPNQGLRVLLEPDNF